MATTGRAPFLHLPVLAGLLFCAGLSVTGCTGSASTVRQDVELDSLRAINGRLAREVRVLSDSLYILGGIESGQYFRDYRALQNRIAELDYSRAVCEDGGNVIATLQVDDLFAPSSAILTETGMTMLEEAVAGLGETLLSGELRVHGHADTSRPGKTLAKTYPTNWELSAARATAVTRYIVEKYGVAPNRIAAVSFGDARPIESDKTVEGRRRNRRIELVVL